MLLLLLLFLLLLFFLINTYSFAHLKKKGYCRFVQQVVFLWGFFVVNIAVCKDRYSVVLFQICYYFNYTESSDDFY